MRRTPEVTRQGHWHIDYIRPLAHGRRAAAWEIGTEEKRPHTEGYMWESEDRGRWLSIEIEAREGSMHFRDGEDGSEPTQIKLPIPRENPLEYLWRRFVRRHRTGPWWLPISADDKYGIYVALVRVS